MYLCCFVITKGMVIANSKEYATCSKEHIVIVYSVAIEGISLLVIIGMNTDILRFIEHLDIWYVDGLNNHLSIYRFLNTLADICFVNISILCSLEQKVIFLF